MSKVETFYDELKSYYSETARIRTRTVSTREFKEKALATYENWKTEIQPLLKTLRIQKGTLENLDGLFENIYDEANKRVADTSYVKAKLIQVNNVFLEQVVVKLKEDKPLEPTANLMESATFLGLDTNWSVAVSALQLQEVAVTLLADRRKIRLDRTSVEKILKKKIKDLSFNDQYEAFSQEVKRLFNVDMPILTMHLRRMRVKVLHEGYNPEPEEKDSIVSFTIGLLKKLNSINNASFAPHSD
jgi:hypothetical protein